MRRSERAAKRQKREPSGLSKPPGPDILRLVAEKLGNQRYLGSLASLARINGETNEICTPLLYRNLVLPRNESLQIFASSYGSVHWRDLADAYEKLAEMDFDLEKYEREELAKHSFDSSRRQTRSETSRLGFDRYRMRGESAHDKLPLLPSAIRLLKIWRYVKTLELDHETLQEMSPELYCAVEACQWSGDHLFPNLTKVIIRSHKPAEPVLLENLESDYFFATLLYSACKVEFCCIDLPELRESPLTTNLGVPAWNFFVLSMRKSIKTVILHNTLNLAPFGGSRALYRVESVPKNKTQDFMVAVRYFLPMSLMAPTTMPASMQAKLQPLESNIGYMELQDFPGLKQSLIDGFQSYLDHRVSADPDVDLKELRSYFEHFQILPTNVPRPDCEACGKEMH